MIGALFALIITFAPAVRAADIGITAGSTPQTQQGAKLTQRDVDNLIDKWAPGLGLSATLVKKISQCEDQGNPYAVHPNVRKGQTTAWSNDIGPLQVNDYFHEGKMVKAGLKITNPVDSLKFGMEMMAKQGTTPWNWSKGCWSK